MKELARKNAEFAVALYRTLGDQPGNMVFSPQGLSTAFAIVHEGARGQTADQIALTLRFPVDRTTLGSAFSALNFCLARDSSATVSNSLWIQNGTNFRPAFLKNAEANFNAEIRIVDFESKDGREVVRKTLDEWMCRQLENVGLKKPEPDDWNPLTRLVVANTVSMSGRWSKPFDPKNTKPEVFHCSATRKVEIPMMRDERMLTGFRDQDGCKVLKLAYREGLDFIAILPSPKTDLFTFEASLTAEKLQQLISGLGYSEVDVVMPKFKLSQRLAAKQTLEAMGMRVPFAPAEADFSGMAEAKLSLGDVIQDKTLDVNEFGTTATARTTIVSNDFSDEGSFIANRPFLFLIRDGASGGFIFMGRVVDPTAE
jgi:serpin B